LLRRLPPLRRAATIHAVTTRATFPFIFLTCILAHPGGAVAGSSSAPSDAPGSPAGTYSAELAAECRDLVARAVRRPYGWAWQQRLDVEPGRTPTIVEMGPRATPAAGLVLLWSGRFLGDVRLVEASRQVARAVAASIAPTGKLFVQPVFGASAGEHEVPAVLPDRGPNCSALALLLAQVADIQSQGDRASDADKQQARYFSAAAFRLSYWLIKQETPNNNWPGLLPNGAASNDGAGGGPIGLPSARAIRLDEAGYRDSTLALILAATTLDRSDLKMQARRPVDALLRLRIPMGATDGGLFPAVLNLSGDGSVPAGFSIGPNAPACRHAMQILLAGQVIIGDAAYAQALADAATATIDRRRGDGLWSREMTRGDQTPLAGPTSAPGAAAMPLFDGSGPGAFGLPGVLAAVAQVQRVGGDRFVAQVAARQSAPLDAPQQIAATLVGLSDEPLSMAWPQSAQERDAWLAGRRQRFADIVGPPPAELTAYTRRLWLIFLCANLDRPPAPASPR
jgi:hypothetical protein